MNLCEKVTSTSALIHIFQVMLMWSSQIVCLYPDFCKRPVLLTVLKFINHRVDLRFDVYDSSSAKDIKDKSREGQNTEKHFTNGPQQRIPSDFSERLKIYFNRQLLRFL